MRAVTTGFLGANSKVTRCDEEWFDGLIATAEGDLAAALESAGIRFYDAGSGKVLDMTIESEACQILRAVTNGDGRIDAETLVVLSRDMASLASCIQDMVGEGELFSAASEGCSELREAIYAMSWAIGVQPVQPQGRCC